MNDREWGIWSRVFVSSRSSINQYINAKEYKEDIHKELEKIHPGGVDGLAAQDADLAVEFCKKHGYTRMESKND